MKIRTNNRLYQILALSLSHSLMTSSQIHVTLQIKTNQMTSLRRTRSNLGGGESLSLKRESVSQVADA